MKRAKTKSKRVDAWAWLTKSQAAAVAGYSVRNFTERVQPRLEVDASDGKGAALRFDVRAVVRAVTSYIAEQNQPKPEDEDPLLTSARGDPKLLDEFRKEATTKLKLANQETRKELIDRAQLLGAMSHGFAAAANCGKKLVLRFGNEAGEIWNEGIESIQDAAITALSAEPKDAD